MTGVSQPFAGTHFRAGRRRGAALFLLTFSISLMLAGTGLTLVAIQQADRRLQQNVVRTGELDGYARAGLEMAVAFTEQVSNWRTRAAGSSGNLFVDFPIGDGKVTVQLFDDVDGQLANNDADPVRIRAVGKRDADSYRLEAQLRPRPHPSLKYTLFGTSANDLSILTSSVVRGPVRSHGAIKSSANDVVQDDASFETMTGYTIASPLTPTSYASTVISAPQPDLTLYESQAAVFYGDGGSVCNVDDCNLTPTINTEGASPNAKGIYWLRAGGREVQITNLHVKGTLIITETGGNMVTFKNGLWLEPGPNQYPVLLVDCSLNDVDIRPDAYLYELNLYSRLGWTGADLNGDGDPYDYIPSQVRGLVWTNATRLRLRNAAWNLMGCAVNGRITVENGVTVDNDPTLLDAFCPGFLDAGMNLVSGSIREVGP